MATRETTYAGMLGALVRFNAALAANASDLTHLEGVLARLAKSVADAQEAAREQAALTASKQEASLRVETLITESERIASGIRKLLIEHYGLRAEKLAEFGLQPFRGRRRQKEPENPKPAPPTPAPELTAPDPSKT
jgi:hypothetical protein